MPNSNALDYQKVINDLDAFINEVKESSGLSKLILRQGLNEAWFSEMLSWLLDVKGSHGFGVRFAQEFLKRIAQLRTNGDKYGNNYHHRNKFLRWRNNAISGTLSTHFSLKNAAIFTEFYLSSKNCKYKNISGVYCDLVFLDLDSSDGLFVCIENKLFTTNHKFQLESYKEIIEKKYERADVIEYVYLTLNGEPPLLNYGSSHYICKKYWIRMSWIYDILDILEKLIDEYDLCCHTTYAKEQLSAFISLLNWLKHFVNPSKDKKLQKLTEDIFSCLVSGASECLFEELDRLNKEARGNWEFKKLNKSRAKFIHSSKSTVPLFIGVLHNLSIALYSKKNDKSIYDKLLIPFGSNPDQIYNLMDIVARDIYKLHFGDSVNLYLGKARRKTSTISDKRMYYRDLFDFIYKNRLELKVLFTIARTKGFKDIIEAEVSSKN